MSYNLLTAVYFRHTFFTTSQYEHLKIHVPPDTTRDLRRYDLILRLVPDGMQLLYNDSTLTREAILQDALSLHFDLSLKDNLFYNYTDLQQEDLRNSMLLLSNRLGRSAGTLHQGTYVSVSEVTPLAGPVFVRPFGRIELELSGILESRYEIRFAARSMPWCYFLMSTPLQELSHPAILDPSGKVVFKDAQTFVLPDGKKVTAFVTDSPVPLGSSNPGFMLVDYTGGMNAYRIIISALPTPDISRLSASGILAELHAEIFLY